MVEMASLEHLRMLCRLLLDTAFPPGCPACQQPVTAHNNFCAECFSKLRLIAEPMCQCCGIPFTVALAGEAQCPECLAEPPAFARARAVMVYDATSAPLVSALKFRDQWSGLPRYVAMMQAAGGALLTEAELIVPVPLNWRRLWRRKFNQSALLAYGVAAAVPCYPQMLRRTRATRPQMRLARKERQKNVRGAFAVTEKFRPLLQGKRVLLVDDVVTTGATASACAEVLLAAGAKQVDVLALARTVKE